MATYQNPEAEDDSYQLNEFMHEDYLGHSNEFDEQHLVTSAQFYEQRANSNPGDGTKIDTFTIDQMMLENQTNRIPPTPDSTLLNPKQPEYRTSFGDHKLATFEGNDFYIGDRHNQYIGGSDELAMAVGNQDIFTPLISPSVLPLGDNISYTTPNLSATTGARTSSRLSSEYFSPLTSPALEAHTHPFLQRRQENFSFSTEERSSSCESGGVPPSSSSSGRVVKVSPLIRPSSSRRRTPKVVALNPSSNSKAPPSGDFSPATFPSNEGSHSISPELLPESLLEPPAIHMPESSGGGGVFGKFSLSEMHKSSDEEQRSKNPEHILNGASGRLSPATPAILMNIRTNDNEKKQHTVDTSNYSSMSVQDALRAAQTTRMKLDSTESSSSSTETERQKNKSKKSSPALTPHAGPNNRLRRTPRLKSQSGPSRVPSNGSASSSNFNGNIRPSPQIKPLLPSRSNETNVSSVKSNYQHIIEGSSAEAGLDYPANINENFRSRRTNHKVAEQERRNRINVALTELAGLLPPCEENIMSKATTVEMAIRFIKQQQEKIEELESRIGGGTDGSDNGSSS